MKNIPEYPFYTLNEPWVEELEKTTGTIVSELQKVMHIDASTLIGDNWTKAHPHYVFSTRNLPTAWKTYEFIFFGIKHPLHIEQCPETWNILSQIPELVTAHFSFLQPGTHVQPHKGYSRMVLRNHLPLIVPEKGDMGIKVKGEIRQWQKGKLLSFNDSFEHEAWNFSNEPRVVLMFDIANPYGEYSAKQINRYKIEHLDDPYLLSIAPKEKWLEWLEKGKFPIHL